MGANESNVDESKVDWRPCQDIPQSAIHIERLDASPPKASQSVRPEREDYSCEYVSRDGHLLAVTISTQDWVDWHSEVWGDQTVTPEIFNNRLAYTWLPKDPRGYSCALIVAIAGGTYRQQLVIPAGAPPAEDKCMAVNIGHLNAFARYIPG